MKINSKSKGKVGELEIVHILKELGFNARRSQQFNGSTGDAPDVICDDLSDLHLEVKRVERLNIDNAMEQSSRDAEKTGKMPCVFHRKNHKKWLTTMNLKDFLSLYSELLWLRKKMK